MSSLLSLAVPRNKWSGFTQGGLSQRWQTKSPSGIGPYARNQETRCAPIPPPVRDTCPYPLLNKAPRQSQQPSDLSTLDQNRSASWAVNGLRNIAWHFITARANNGAPR